MPRTMLPTIIATAMLLWGCGDDGSCDDVEALTRSDRVCQYEASCAGETYRLTSSWNPISGGEADVTYECWGTDGIRHKKTFLVKKNPPPFCTAEGFKEHCGFDVTLPGQ